MLTWSIAEKFSPQEDPKEEDPQHLPTGKTSKYYSCSESVDGKMINVAEGLQLFENVLDSSETNQLTLLINGIQAVGRKGRTSVGSTRGFNGQGRDTILFGCQHPEAHSDISEPIPACLQVIIDRLVAWHLIPPSKVPDSCSIHILDEVCTHYLLFVFQILQKCQLL
jgi:alkylated DNA repair protein alkB family protein 5